MVGFVALKSLPEYSVQDSPSLTARGMKPLVPLKDKVLKILKNVKEQYFISNY
jgi:hypothetical protein